MSKLIKSNDSGKGNRTGTHKYGATNRGRGRGKGKKSGRMNVCRSTSQSGISTTDEARLLMRSESDDELPDIFAEEPVDDEKQRGVGVRANKVIRAQHIDSTDTAISVQFPHQTILDTGTEWSIIGGPAWAVTMHSGSLKISAVDQQMSPMTMRHCDAITAISDSNGTVYLLGLRYAVYSPNLTDGEAVVNTHYIREAGIKVDDVSSRHGGGQCLTLPSGATAPLGYDPNSYKAYVNCRRPTQEELECIKVIWVNCHSDDIMIDNGIKPCRDTSVSSPSTDTSTARAETDSSVMKEKASLPSAASMDTNSGGISPIDESDDGSVISLNEDVRSPVDWSGTLGECPVETVANTLNNTTQYFPNAIESEKRSYPIQHRGKRLFPLHGRRILGRTCGDTFFSSIRSIRGYTCAQLFVAILSDYLFLKCIRRESQVPGTYQDYCREVGVPNELLTNNSKVQSGEKFKTINRQNQTKHVFSTPHCQNQNFAERRIQDVKHRTVLVLFLSEAPLEFWCYAVDFVVDCLNHTSKQKLSNKTPEEVMNGNTPDISPFRYKFWQPILYLDPSAKYPDCKWKPGYWIGRARYHGDPFTYKIWTEPEAGEWKKGRELVRNVIKPRETAIEEGTNSKKKIYSHEYYEDFHLVKEKDQPMLNEIISRLKQKKRKPISSTKARKKQKVVPQPNERRSPVIDNDEQGKVKECPSLVTINEDNNEVRIFDDDEYVTAEVIPPDGFTEKDETSRNRILETIVEDVTDDKEEETPVGSKEIYDELDPCAEVGQSMLISINGYRFKESRLQLILLFDCGDTQWCDFRDVKEDHPRKCAEYIIAEYMPRKRKKRNKTVC